MMTANLQDLTRELWLRNRNAGQIKWTTKNGESIPINEMSDTHLLNAIKMLLQRQYISELTEEYYAHLDKHI